MMSSKTALILIGFALAVALVNSRPSDVVRPIEVRFSSIVLPEYFKGQMSRWLHDLDAAVVLDRIDVGAASFLGDDALAKFRGPALLFHFTGPDATFATNRFRALPKPQLERLRIQSVTLVGGGRVFQADAASDAGSGANAYVPAWDNIAFSAVFDTQAAAEGFPVLLAEWCATTPYCPQPTFQPFDTNSVVQAWTFLPGPNVTFAQAVNVSHQFYAVPISQLKALYGIVSIAVTPILPPSPIPLNENIQFTFDLELPYSAVTFKADIAQLLRVPLTSFNLTVTVVSATRITFFFDGANAVTLAHQLDAIPIDALSTYAGVSAKLPSVAITPPPPGESSSKLKYFLIGIGVVIAVALIPLIWFIRKRRLARRGDGEEGGSNNYSSWDRYNINDRDAYMRLK